MLRCVIAGLAAALLAGSAAAQVQRNFPPNALRGWLAITAPPDALLNGEAVRLAPGARIRGQDNLLKMPATLVGQRQLVHYTVDTSNLVKDVWILRSDEAARKPWPWTPDEAQAWSFDVVAQTWTKP
jgi:hypothetical protein